MFRKKKTYEEEYREFVDRYSYRIGLNDRCICKANWFVPFFSLTQGIDKIVAKICSQCGRTYHRKYSVNLRFQYFLVKEYEDAFFTQFHIVTREKFLARIEEREQQKKDKEDTNRLNALKFIKDKSATHIHG